MSTPWLIAFLALWAVVLIEGMLVLGTFRRVAVVLEAAEGRLRELPAPGPGGLPIGAAVPPFAASTANGSAFSDADLRGKISLVLFLSSGCPPCGVLADELSDAEAIPGTRLLVVLNDRSECLELGLSSALPIAYQRNGEVSRAFQTTATPHAFLVDSRGVILASGTPNSRKALRDLVEESLEGGDRIAVPEEVPV